MANDLVKILDQANQEIPEFLVQQAHSCGPSANGVRTQNLRNEFGGIDMRRNDRNREPFAHEPLENW